MRTLGRLAAITMSCSVLSLVPIAAMAAPSTPTADGTRWTTIGTFGAGKHQACKMLVDDGARWKVKNRLVNGNRTKVGAGMTVEKDGKDTKSKWNSGLIAKGATSAVGAVSFPKGDAHFSLVSFEYESQAGDGGPVAIAKIGFC